VYEKKLINIPIKITGITPAKVEKVHANDDKNPNKIERNADFQ